MKVDSTYLLNYQRENSDWPETYKVAKGTRYILVSAGESKVSHLITERVTNTWADYLEPITTKQNRLEKYFNFLVSKWKSDTAFQSSINQMVEHPAYQEIIGLGEDVVPLLIKELERNPDHWFVALKRITGEDPVDIEQRGNFKEMVRAWINWGNRK